MEQNELCNLRFSFAIKALLGQMEKFEKVVYTAMLISDFGYLLCLCKQMLFFLEIHMKAFKNKGHYLQLTLKGFRKK